MKIERLKIGSGNLPEQLHFYKELLGLKVSQQNENSFQVQLGYSVLEIEKQENATPYHIAFHIPANREEQALQWLKERTTIIKDGEEEIVDFPNWNARSIYFYDADRNILEFISRRHLFPSKTTEFSSHHLMGISEIGLATSNVRQAFDFLNQNFSLQKVTGDYEVFCATGDEKGLFIVIDKNRKDWFPSNDEAFASEFEIQFSTAGRSGRVAYRNERLELL